MEVAAQSAKQRESIDNYTCLASSSEVASRIVVRGAGSLEVNGNYTWLQQQEQFLSDTGQFSMMYDDGKWWLQNNSLVNYGSVYVTKSTSRHLLICAVWEPCLEDGMPGLQPAPALHEFRPEKAHSEGTMPGCWKSVQLVRIVVQKLDGASLEFDARPDSTIHDVQQRILASWGIVPFEQRLLSGDKSCADCDRIWELIERRVESTDAEASSACDAGLFMTCIRTVPFHFDPELAHPSLRIAVDGLSITHGGQLEYQGAFASGVLEASSKVTVQIDMTGSSHCVSGDAAAFDGRWDLLTFSLVLPVMPTGIGQ